MGQSIAQSGMFGCENEKQGEVLAMACLAQQRDPLSIAMDFHLMHGRLTLRADAMLGRLVRAGGKYQIIQASSECAEIDVTLADRSFREKLTWPEAQLEPFVYEGKPKDIMPLLLSEEGRKKLKLSSNYATPRRRGQHLWARVCSDAVRKIAPHLVTGSYTPEECTEIVGKNIPSCIESTPAASIEESDAAELREERAAIQEKAIDAEVAEVQHQIILADAASSQEAVALKETAKEVKELAVFQRNMADQIDQAEVESLKDLVRQTAQLPGCEGLADAVRSTLTSQGLKFADLSWDSARKLREKILAKELVGMAELALNGGKGK